MTMLTDDIVQGEEIGGYRHIWESLVDLPVGGYVRVDFPDELYKRRFYKNFYKRRISPNGYRYQKNLKFADFRLQVKGMSGWIIRER